jgi:DEAD/DEAH box helicase domain-containing protein
LIPVALDYYTEPLRETDVSLMNLLQDTATPIAAKAYGELQVTTQVKGFRKRMWLSGDNIGEEPLDLPPTELQTTGYWIAISEETVSKLAKDGLWTNAPNDYGPEWPKIRDRIRARDGYCCQVCGIPESGVRRPGDEVSPERNPAGTQPARQPGDDMSPERNLAGTKPARQHDVHHKIPFRQFRDEGGRVLRERANQPDNLVTLCPECHKKAEQNVRMRSGLAGLATVLGQLAPLYLMCDAGDLGIHFDPQAAFANGLPAVVLFDQVPAGIGFSQKLFEIHTELLNRSLDWYWNVPGGRCPQWSRRREWRGRKTGDGGDL